MNIDKSIRNIIGTKKHGGRRDWDGDGVRNKKDCQPRNTMRQDDGRRRQYKGSLNWLYRGHKVNIKESFLGQFVPGPWVNYKLFVDGKYIMTMEAISTNEHKDALVQMRAKARENIDNEEDGLARQQAYIDKYKLNIDNYTRIDTRGLKSYKPKKNQRNTIK